MRSTIKRLNNDYVALKKDARNRVLDKKVGHKGSIGWVHNLHFKDNGLRLDIALKDGRIVSDVDAFDVEFDPWPAFVRNSNL